MSKVKILIALTIAMLLLAVSCVLAGEEYKANFEKTLPFKAGDRFSLENVNGGVTIATWKEAKVEIKAVKTARRHKEDLDRVEIQVDESSGGVAVKAVWPKFPQRADVSVEFTVMVPEGVELTKFETVNGDVDVTGPYTRGEVGTTNGSVTVQNAAGDLKAGTTNGRVRVSHFDGHLEAETTNGGIELEDVTIKNGLSAETTNGSIHLVVAGTLDADLKARTTNGSVTVDFPITLQSLHQSKHRVEGTIGKGGVPISLETTNGSIRLTK